MGVSLLTIRLTRPEKRHRGESLRPHPCILRSVGSLIQSGPAKLEKVECPVYRSRVELNASIYKWYYAGLYTTTTLCSVRVDKLMNRQKNWMRIGTQHLRAMPVNLRNS